MSCGDCPKPGPCATFYVPLLPCPPELCPTKPCPAESPCEQCDHYDNTGCRSWWCDRKPDTTKKAHEDCWCNGWNMGDGYGRSKTTTQDMPVRPMVRRSATPRLSYRQQLVFDRLVREKMYPPPPSNICSYKPCVMEMIPPSWCNPTWSGIAQKCAKEPKRSNFYVPGPCKRPGCLHISDLKPKCCYDGPCKAHCFETVPCPKPTRHPRGYPHIC